MPDADLTLLLSRAQFAITIGFLLSGYALALPLTLAYNSWAFWVFRARVR